MPKVYNTLAVRVAALREGRTILTRKAARGVRTRGVHGRRIDEETAYRGGFMANGKRVVPVPVAVVVAEVEAVEPSPFELAITYAKTLVLSGVEPRAAIMRAATAHKVAPRELAVALATLLGNR